MWTLGLVVAALLAHASGNPGSQLLAGYLERAGLTWLALPDCGAERARCEAFEQQEGEGPAAVADRVRLVAGDVADLLTTGFYVARLDGTARLNDEPSPYGGDRLKARAGLLLMSLAFHESRFRGYVAHCTDAAWRATPEGRRLLRFGSCDGARASTLWQLHLGGGVRLGWRAGEEWRPTDMTGVSLENEVAFAPGWVERDDFLAAAVALHMARASIRMTSTLRNYTGEWSGPAPNARAREKLAADYFAAHPFSFRCTGVEVAGDVVQCFAAEETTP